MSVNTSAGLASGNPAAIQVLDIWTGRQAFEEKLWRAPDSLAHRVAEVSDLYNGARIVVERNNTGYATISTLKDFGYADRLYKHLDAQQRRAVEDSRKELEKALEEARYGFPTKRSTSRWGHGPRGGSQKATLIYGVRSFVPGDGRYWDDPSSFAALPGYEDDLFMALAIGWYVLRMMNGKWTGFVGVLPEVGDAR